MMAHYLPREFGYQPDDFQQISTLLHTLTGIKLAASKDSMVYSRLVRRIRALQLSTFAQYLHYLQQHPEEEQQFINALTTNLTAFFREPHHFELLSSFLTANPQTKTIWCSACSSGEEAYSIAMTLALSLGRFDHGIQIIASDIDSQVLNVAAQGIYPLERLQGLPGEHYRHFFYRGKASKTGFARVIPELQRCIDFKRINLLDETWPIDAPIDVIFCRNVMIYFDKPTQRKVLTRMIRLLAPTGLYIAGHSENYSHLSHIVTAIGKTTYQPSAQFLQTNACNGQEA